jgi:hypothetical protein
MFKSPNKKKIWTVSGTYYDTLRNFAFCDSIVTVNLTINNAKRVTVSESACRWYQMKASTRVITASGNYNDTLKSLETGCDSIVTRNLNILNPDKYVIHNGSLLTARNTNATYQWLNCTRNYKVMDSATKRSFIAKTNEEYAVAVTENGCTDTSDCVLVTNASRKNLNAIEFSLKPNPNSGKFIINSNQSSPSTFIISDLTGKIIYKKANVNLNQYELSIQTKPGIYNIQIISKDNQTVSQKLIIQ